MNFHYIKRPILYVYAKYFLRCVDWCANSPFKKISNTRCSQKYTKIELVYQGHPIELHTDSVGDKNTERLRIENRFQLLAIILVSY
jgi:hypothetical protein